MPVEVIKEIAGEETSGPNTQLYNSQNSAFMDR